MSNDFWKDYEPEPTRPAPMTTEKALDLALEALYGFIPYLPIEQDKEQCAKYDSAIKAIKQARALDKKAENARELGLDYAPVPENLMDALRFDVAMRDAAPVQEPVGFNEELHQERERRQQLEAELMRMQGRELKLQMALNTPAAQPAPVQEPLSELEKDAANLLFALHDAWPYVHGNCTIESKKKAIQALIVKHGEFADLHPPAARRQCTWPICQSEEYQQALAEQIKQELVTGAAQPAVPDAFGTREGEHPQYIQGWNDCRAEMLSMRKRVKP
jgi:hypothetical protein